MTWIHAFEILCCVLSVVLIHDCLHFIHLRLVHGFPFQFAKFCLLAGHDLDDAIDFRHRHYLDSMISPRTFVPETRCEPNKCLKSKLFAIWTR